VSIPCPWETQSQAAVVEIWELGVSVHMRSMQDIVGSSIKGDMISGGRRRSAAPMSGRCITGFEAAGVDRGDGLHVTSARTLESHGNGNDPLSRVVGGTRRHKSWARGRRGGP
jgi:hypothetical protein